MSRVGRVVTVEERRARLARRHGLLPSAPARDVVDAAERMVGLHASDPASMYLSAWARVPGITVVDIDAELYDRQRIVRHLCMRRTMFALPRPLVAVAQRACGDRVAATIRRKLVAELERSGVAPDGNRWIDDVLAQVVATIAEHGPSTGVQLSTRVPILRTPLAAGPAEVALTSRLLTLLAAEGGIVRGRQVGSWVSSQHRWTLAGDLTRSDTSEAEATIELVRRWLWTFGPAPLADIVWWTGLGLTRVRAALTAIGAVHVVLEDAIGDEVGLLLPDDVEPEPPVEPWVALLPSLDSTPMGWKQREWFGATGDRIFDQHGNIGPTVWSDGRVIGGWAQRRSGDVGIALFDGSVSGDVLAALHAKADALTTWLRPAWVTPRFPTPIDRALRS